MTRWSVKGLADDGSCPLWRIPVLSVVLSVRPGQDRLLGAPLLYHKRKRPAALFEGARWQLPYSIQHTDLGGPLVQAEQLPE